MTPRAARRHGAGRPPAAGVAPVALAAALLVALLLDGALAGCGPARLAAGAARTTVAPTPASAGDLGRLLLTTLPSGLPRMPDERLQPRAGQKMLDDVAGYAADPAHERTVLRGYGFRWGWERFWGRGSAETSVFVEQFTGAAGARSFAADLAANEAAHYGAVVHESPPGMPAGCRLLTVAEADPALGLAGPTALAWCARGPFSVAVTVVADTVEAATDQVADVARAQLARLPA